MYYAHTHTHTHNNPLIFFMLTFPVAYIAFIAIQELVIAGKMLKISFSKSARIPVHISLAQAMTVEYNKIERIEAKKLTFIISIGAHLQAYSQIDDMQMGWCTS